MLKAKQIPDEARAAAKKAYFNSPHLSWQDAIDVALVAMLAAWPGVDYRPGSKVTKTWRDPGKIILPLPQEVSDADA